MKTALAAMALLVGLAACENRGERGEATGGIDRADDTLVTTQTEVDTTLIERDTQITVDTMEGGEGEVGDTLNR